MKKLGFGLMRLPLLNAEDQTSIDKEQVCRMVDTFIERGFTYFDTAYMYHKNTSELAARECLVKRHPRDSFTLASKMPSMFLKEKGDLERFFNEQLEKCGVEYFDYYLMHTLCTDFYDTVEALDGFGFLARMKAAGKIRHVGFSFHDGPELLDRILTDHPESEFVQIQFNYLDYDSPSVRSRECLEVAKKHGTPVIVMEPVKGGKLANVPADVAEMFSRVTPGASPASWALRYAASFDNVFMVLSGMSDMAQLIDNTETMKDFEPLSDNEMKTVYTAAKMIDGKITVPCTACRYCVDECPMSIPIPEYFELYNRECAGENVVSEYKETSCTHASPADCISCRSCEGHCPQHLKISELLKDVDAKFGVAK